LRKFKPQLVPTIALIVFLPIFGYLANWQYQKAKNLEQLQIFQNKNLNNFHLQLPNDVQLADDKYKFSNYRLKGQYSELSFLLDNQIFNNRAGYHLFSLFLTDKQKLILINRGWLPQGRTRQDLPKFTTPNTELEIEGYLHPIQNINLAQKYKPKINDKVWQIIDVDLISKFIGQKVYPYQLRLLATQDPKKIKQYPITFNYEKRFRTDKIIMHKSYAGQWTLFAVTAIVLWLIYSWKKV